MVTPWVITVGFEATRYHSQSRITLVGFENIHTDTASNGGCPASRRRGTHNLSRSYMRPTGKSLENIFGFDAVRSFLQTMAIELSPQVASLLRGDGRWSGSYLVFAIPTRLSCISPRSGCFTYAFCSSQLKTFTFIPQRSLLVGAMPPKRRARGTPPTSESAWLSVEERVKRLRQDEASADTAVQGQQHGTTAHSSASRDVLPVPSTPLRADHALVRNCVRGNASAALSSMDTQGIQALVDALHRDRAQHRQRVVATPISLHGSGFISACSGNRVIPPGAQCSR